MAQPSSLSNLPKISSLQGISLVNGVLNKTSGLSESGGVGPRGPKGAGDNLDVLSRIVALEAMVGELVKTVDTLQARLDGASIQATCAGGSVSVTLNI